MPAVPLILLTRQPVDNKPLAARLGWHGVPCGEHPCLQMRLQPPAELPGEWAAVAFPSRHAVAALADWLPSLAARCPVLAAVGPGTARVLAAAVGRPPDLVAAPPTGWALGQALAGRLRPGDRVLVPRGDRATGDLERALRAAGMELEVRLVYTHVAPPEVPLPPGPLVPVLASPSAAERLARDVRRDRAEVRVCVAIGPTTARWVRAHTDWAVTQASGTGVADLTAAALAAWAAATGRAVDPLTREESEGGI